MKNLPIIISWIIFTTSTVNAIEAEDCVLYEGHNMDKSLPTKTMYRQLSTGVSSMSRTFAATLFLTSQISNKKCNMNILGNTLAVSCPNGPMIYRWGTDIFKYHDNTEIWLHLGGFNDRNNHQRDGSTDLAIIIRRGEHRGHFLFLSSELQPPIEVRWEPMQSMSYYYNCVTGCLYSKSVLTSSGVHTFFFRPGPEFNHLSITYNSTEYRNFHELSLNSSDFNLDNNWNNVTVVWNKQEGDIGVLVNDNPIRDLRKYSRLNPKSGVEAEIRGGDGLLKLCEEGFQNMAKTQDLNSTDRFTDDNNSNLGRSWLVVFAFICIGLLVLMVTLLVILLLKTKKELIKERTASRKNENNMNTLAIGQKGSNKGSTSLYPDVNHGKLESGNNSLSRDSIDGLKNPSMASQPSRYSSNGTKT